MSWIEISLVWSLFDK